MTAISLPVICSSCESVCCTISSTTSTEMGVKGSEGSSFLWCTSMFRYIGLLRYVSEVVDVESVGD